ncbi:T9SS type A sorting domain-containing protein [Flavobacterium sp.]|jgi:hypothetical protein|uniref:T9SS type A sorting domain-containing protein n=1 Tax=Flavobacterium sp. TaxID=239 RepID=UPI0037C183C0
MKKLLFFMILVPLFVNAQIINIPDANFKTCLLDASPILGYHVAKNSNGDWVSIDTNSNNEIEQNEALAIYELYINSGYDVSNLTGLHFFVNLINLGASYQPSLTSINLSTLINLKGFDVTYSGLTQLDVSGLTQLEVLICYNNQFTNIIFGDNYSLKDMNVSNNYLTSLNVRNLEALEYLSCSNNLLQNLYLNGLQNLENVYCPNNQLTSLLLDNLPQLSVLQCQNNQITELNFDNLPVLNIVVCHHNQLTTLDFSLAPSLYLFGCSHNNLTSINLKNGLTQLYYSQPNLSWGNNPNLSYICADADEIPPIQDFLYACQIGQAVTITSNCGLATSGNENTENVSTFPNPNNGTFSISNLEKESFIEIYDVLGKKVHEQIINNNQVVNIQKVSKGIYFAKIKSGDKVYKTEKIVVE